MLVSAVQLSKLRSPIPWSDLGRVKLSRLLQPAKVLFSIIVTPEGIVTLLSAVQRRKALVPIACTLPRFTLSSEEQPQNAYSPIDFTLAGISTEVRLVQAQKASSAISTSAAESFISVRLVQS